MFRFAFAKLGGLLEFQTAFFAVASKQPEHRFWMRGKIGQRVLCQKGGSWPRFVKRGGLEVLPYFPAHGREGEAAPLLRRNRLILLVQVAILMASRTLAKNQAFWQNMRPNAAALAATGRRYRNSILALGGSRPPMEVFREFRGREPTTAALLRHSGLAA